MGQRLEHCEDASACPKPDSRSWHSAWQRGEPPVELGKAFGRNDAVASSHGIKRRIELKVQIETANDTAQADDLGAYRKSSQKLRALQNYKPNEAQ